VIPPEPRAKVEPIPVVQPGQPGYWMYRVLTTPMRVSKRRRHLENATKPGRPRKG
jgi:hypothetical protein